MTLRRSIRQTSGVLTLVALIALLLATVGVSAASAAGLCTRVDNADGTVTLNWDADGDDKWSVRRGVPGDNTAVQVIRVGEPPTWTGGDAANDYSIRYVRQNNAEVPCTTVVDPGDFCSVQLLGNGDVVLTIEDNDAKSWAWRRGKDGAASSYKGEIENFSVTDSAPAAGVYTYEVISRLGGGEKLTDDCGTITIEGAGPVVNVCSATLEDNGDVTVVWDDNGARNWSVRRGVDGAGPTFLAIGENFTYTDTNPPAGVELNYVIRAKFANNERIEANCGTITIDGGDPILVDCTVIDNGDGTALVDWNDDGANKWSVRRSKNGGAINYRGETETPGWTSTVENGNTYTWEIVSRFSGGVKVTSPCGALAIEIIN